MFATCEHTTTTCTLQQVRVVGGWYHTHNSKVYIETAMQSNNKIIQLHAPKKIIVRGALV